MLHSSLWMLPPCGVLPLSPCGVLPLSPCGVLPLSTFGLRYDNFPIPCRLGMLSLKRYEQLPLPCHSAMDYTRRVGLVNFLPRGRQVCAKVNPAATASVQCSYASTIHVCVTETTLDRSCDDVCLHTIDVGLESVLFPDPSGFFPPRW